jgi:hypothetical protein
MFSVLAFVPCISSLALAQPSDHEQRAKRILDTSGIRGGLFVHIGCGDGKLAVSV